MDNLGSEPLVLSSPLSSAVRGGVEVIPDCEQTMPESAVEGASGRWVNSHTVSDDSTRAMDNTITMDVQGDRLAPEELRRMLNLPHDNDIRDYGDMSAIGMGGLGAVFSAREPGLNREVAIKVLRPEFRNRQHHIENLLREARTTAQIDHPNIVPVHRMGVFDDIGIYFTMKRIDGENLRAVIRKLRDSGAYPHYRRLYPLRRRLEIFVSICQAIAYAHRRGVIHRDLKPGNIMLGEYGEVLVCDWGLAIYRDGHDEPIHGHRMELDTEGMPQAEPSAPRKSTVSGTPAFMAPEQATGRNDLIDERTDVYCLGAILYTLLTLEPAPFDATQPTDQLLAQVAAGKLVRPRRKAKLLGIPRELDAITMKAMAYQQEKRYRNVPELLRDVRNYLDRYPVEAYGSNPFYRLCKLCMRHPLIPVTLIAAVLTLGGVSFAQFSIDRRDANAALSQARYHAAQSEAYYHMAMRTYRQIKYGNSPNAAELEQNFSQQTHSFISYANLAFDNLAEIRLRNDQLPPELAKTLGDVLLRNFQFCLATNQPELFRTFYKQMRSRWGGTIRALLRGNPQLARLITRFEDNTGRLELRNDTAGAISVRPDSGVAAKGPADWRELTSPVTLLPAGSYLLRVSNKAATPYYLPIRLHAAESRLVQIAALPLEVAPEMVPVPEGEFITGRVTGGMPQKLDLPFFLMKRHEVTFGEYLDFWKQLPNAHLKARYMGKGADSERRSFDLWDAAGKLRAPYRADMPVKGILGDAAAAYCRYLSRKTGRHLRLPTPQEWEKAGRGVDGRLFPWGNEPDQSAALLADNPGRRRHPEGAVAGAFPRDRSGYGVCDLMGNVREYVRLKDAGDDEDEYNYAVMGGSYRTKLNAAHSWVTGAVAGDGDVGFRYVEELPHRDGQAEEN